MSIESLNDLPATRAYLQRVGAEPRSLKSAVIKEISGNYWRDVATIRFTKGGDIDCSSLEHQPTDIEKIAIAAEFASVSWPQLKKLKRIIDAPAMIRDAAEKDIFIFRDREGGIIMVQVRIESPKGKSYVPWTYWDDDRWRCAEPEGSLPLYNAERLDESTTVFVHEGAKAARHCQRLVDAKTPQDRKALIDHPWGRELTGSIHIGWIGGALSPFRTDWSALKASGVKRVYIIADNDEPGRSAVPAISQQLNVPTFMIQFTDEFPVSFDMADEFPESMWAKSEDDIRHYTGPAFRDCLHPATWATDLIPNPRGKPTVVLRESFRCMWAYVEEADVFVCTEMPEIIRAESILNKMLAAFSHSSETSRLIVKSYRGRSARICYRPDHDGLTVTFRGSSAINLHVPSTVRPLPGSPNPWLEFLAYMFINKDERKQVERWCATIIARPDIRMGYGLLLVSERQGIGKTTLGATILGPLVGVNNVGFPSESDIQSSFNDWVANKRLVVVNEIYSGSSWKAYHSLKSVITDKDVQVNQKYMRPYTIENFAHVIACSNSLRALKMENDDRRWFYPEISEVPWPQAKFDSLRRWLEGGGLGIIKSWAMAYGDYVRPSERAPMTDRKQELIEGSRSEAQKEAAALATVINESNDPKSLIMTEVMAWVKQSVDGKVFDSDYEIRKAMNEAGVKSWPKRVKVAGRLQYALLNDSLLDRVQRMEEREALEAIRSFMVKPRDVMPEVM